MSNIATASRKSIDAVITGIAAIGLLLAITNGMSILDFGNLDFALTIGFPAIIAPLVYLHYHRDEEPVVGVALGLWGVIAGAVGLFATFFVVMDNPALVSDAPLSSLLFASSIANYVLGVVALSGLYAVAGYFKSRAIILVAPVTQLIAFSFASYLVPIIV